MTEIKRQSVQWYADHKWTTRYIALIVSAELVLSVLQIRGVL